MSQQLPTRRVFFRGRQTGSGLELGRLSDDAHATDVPSGVGVVGSVRMSATDQTVQEDARQIRWSCARCCSSRSGRQGRRSTCSAKPTASCRWVSTTAVDHAPTANVTLQMECGPGCKGARRSDADIHGRGHGAAEWSHLKVPLGCFANAGAHMDSITQPFELSSAGPFEVSVANIRLETGHGSP